MNIVELSYNDVLVWVSSSIGLSCIFFIKWVFFLGEIVIFSRNTSYIYKEILTVAPIQMVFNLGLHINIIPITLLLFVCHLVPMTPYPCIFYNL